MTSLGYICKDADFCKNVCHCLHIFNSLEILLFMLPNFFEVTVKNKR